ncbi:MAG: DUF4923 family protein, partial [Muribaculaceae bacterium]|nr:DUF4923 family protein [Muribaculaceae bacterium]
WHYSSPGCAFTSENLLAKAGGAAAAGNIKEKLAPTYQAIGINSNNTQFSFDENNNFSAKINGIPLSGTYTFDPSTSKITLQTMLLSISGNVTRTTNGIGLMFESKKLLTVLQTLGKVSGNSTLNTVGELSKNFDGVRLGFDLAK